MSDKLVALTIAFALWAVCSRPGAAQDTPAERIAGCYTLTLGPWSPALGPDSAYYAVPRAVRLDTAASAASAYGPGRRLSPNIQYPRLAAFPGTPRWEIRDGGVVLTWSNGFTPTIISLHVRDSVLVGTATALSDAHSIGEPPRPRAVVTARRHACGSG